MTEMPTAEERSRCSCSFPHMPHDFCDGNPRGTPFLTPTAERLYEDICFKPPEQWLSVIRDAFAESEQRAEAAERERDELREQLAAAKAENEKLAKDRDDWRELARQRDEFRNFRA